MWYATRASGYTALVLLSAAVVLGLLTSMRWSRPDWPRFVVQSLHRNVSLMVVVFLVIHILTSVVDPFARLNFADAVIPFVATYRPLWLGLGVVSFEVLVAITATSLMRHRLGWGGWRAVHMLAYASWPVAVVHGVGTGTDTKSVWALLLVTGCVIVVLGGLVWRLAEGWPRLAVFRAAGIGAGVAGTALLIGWMATGPLQPGWAKAAGTPANLLAGATAVKTSPSASGSPAPLQAGLNDRLTGSVVSSATAVTARLTDSRDTALQLVIVDNADGSGTMSVTRSGTSVCTSAATIGDAVTARCGSVLVSVQVFDAGGGSVGGTLTTRQVRG